MSERKLPLPPELGHLSTFVDSHVECLVEPSGELRSIALCTAKHIFDWALGTEKSSKPHLGTLLTTLTQATPPQTRSQASSVSKRGHSPSPTQKPAKKIDTRETPLPSLFIEGMNIDQIWQQLDLRTARICENLQILIGEDEDEDEAERENVESNEEYSDHEEEEEEEGDNDDDDENGAENMNVDEADIWEGLSDVEEDGGSTAEGIVDLRDGIFDDDEDDGSQNSMLDAVHGQRLLPSGSYAYAQAHPDLDDGFFDLAAFNVETSEVEIKELSRRKLNSVADDDSAEEFEVNLFTSVDDPVSEDDLAQTELFYSDFFEPPQNRNVRASKVRFHEQVTVKKIKAVGKGMPVSSMDDEDSDEEFEVESDSSDDSTST